MVTKIEYVDTTQLYATQYIRNSKAIAVLWAIFTICYAIIGIVAFLTPEWIGDPDNETADRMGLWQICRTDELLGSCQRRWQQIFSVEIFSFKLATLFMVASVALALLTICSFMLLIFMKSTRVFHICGWMQIISAFCMIIACATYPFGWNSEQVRKICGPEANRFVLGFCDIRWAYLLAIIGCIDGFVLATLAFILATKHVRLQPDPLYQNSLFKGEVNNAYITDAVSLAGSRKSMNLQPVILVASPHNMAQHDDTISQFSSRTPNHRY